MLTKSDSRLLEDLSALADGELEPAEVARVCTRWRDDPELRGRWHAYQLIGDVLRSEDLAASGARDAALLASLRGRLANEPVVLAPEPASASPDAPVPMRAAARRGRWAWKAPAAVAAGFVAVAGVLTVVGLPETAPPGGAVLARSGAGTGAPAAALRAASPDVVLANDRVVRDARLDRYLNAHKQFAGTSALGMPSGFLRNAAVETPNR